MGKAPNFGPAGVQMCSESCVTLRKLLAHSEPQFSLIRGVCLGSKTPVQNY